MVACESCSSDAGGSDRYTCSKRGGGAPRKHGCHDGNVRNDTRRGPLRSCRGEWRIPMISAEEFLILEDRDLVQQCMVDHYRASGPGGQKRNKTSSAVRLRHRPTGLAATASDDRSQHVNKRRAIRRLRETIARQVRGDLDAGRYQPSERMSACMAKDGRIVVGRRDRRYCLVVAELLDLLVSVEMRVSEAAALVGTSTAHFVQFLCKDVKLKDRVNQLRAAAGAKPLR